MKSRVFAVLLIFALSSFSHAQITAQFFGAQENRISANPPPPTWPPTDGNGVNAQIGCLRFWDDGFKWYNLETSSGGYAPALTTFSHFIQTTMATYPFTNCIIYTFGGTPAWAALGTDSNCSATQGTSTCVPPNDLDSSSSTCNATPNSTGSQNATVQANCGNGSDSQWQIFVYKIVITIQATGFAGQVYFELWNEPDGSGVFWSNSATFGGLGGAPTRAEQPPLVRAYRMYDDAARIIRGTMPSAKILSPSVHGPTVNWLHLLVTSTVNNPGCSGACSAALGGLTWSASTDTGASGIFDYMNAHLRSQTNNADPTQIIPMYNNAVTEWTLDTLPGSCIFDDEIGPVGPVQSVNLDTVTAYVGIIYALSASFNAPPICQTNWYQWDNGSFFLQGTQAGTAFDQMANWLIGSTVNLYSLAGSIYSITGTSASGQAFKITWDSSQNCTSGCTTASQAEAFGYYIDLSGAQTQIVGGTAPVGLKPIYLSTLPAAATFSHWLGATGISGDTKVK